MIHFYLTDNLNSPVFRFCLWPTIAIRVFLLAFFQTQYIINNYDSKNEYI